MFDFSHVSFIYIIWLISSSLILVEMYIFVYKPLRNNLKRYIIMLAYTFVFQFIIYSITWIDKVIMLSVIAHLLSITGMSVIFKEKIGTMTVIHLVGLPVVLITDMLTYLIFSSMVGMENFDMTSSYGVMSIGTGLSMILAAIIYKLIKLRIVITKHMIILKKISIILLPYIFLVLLLRYVSQYDLISDVSGYIGLFIVTAIFLCVNFFLVTILHDIRSENNLIREHGQYLDFIQPMMESLKGTQHDFKNHLTTILGLASTDRCESIVAYVSEINLSLASSELPLDIASPVISAVIASKYQAASIHGISFVVKLTNTVLPCKNYESTKILANLLDNAIEETSKITEGNKTIRITGKTKDNHYILNISNPLSKTSNINMPKLFVKRFSTKEDKQNHGYGLIEVAKIVDRYNGSKKAIIQDGTICICISLPIK